ncbi:MAG: Gfo/Idh/MocA family oxidoreductase [Planctomycetales bacterium]|nr:Gfo/Idh/MocA family oxidoreductase [Planctomycetales bacterium]
MTRRWRIVGINFDHFHMGDLLRMACDHPAAEVVGICDAQVERMQGAIKTFRIPGEQVFTNVHECLESTRPDVAILCPNPAEHATLTEQVAAHGVHVLIEKPFAASLADADRMLAAVQRANVQLAINWPLRWYPSHAHAYDVIQTGRIGDVLEVHFYDGNRGPLWHGADKVERAPTQAEKETSWFYRRDAGGGSLLDYLGYGTTLGTWYQQGRKPLEICCLTDHTPGLEVDEHSVTIARYAHGLSKFETRWGTFTDPWTQQPQPKCGFVIQGTAGTLSSYDFENTLRVQDASDPAGVEIPVPELTFPHANPIQYFLDCLEHECPVAGPLSPTICRIGQQIVDTARRSALEKRTLPLLD